MERLKQVVLDDMNPIVNSLLLAVITFVFAIIATVVLYSRNG